MEYGSHWAGWKTTQVSFGKNHFITITGFQNTLKSDDFRAKGHQGISLQGISFCLGTFQENSLNRCSLLAVAYLQIWFWMPLINWRGPKRKLIPRESSGTTEDTQLRAPWGNSKHSSGSYPVPFWTFHVHHISQDKRFLLNEVKSCFLLFSCSTTLSQPPHCNLQQPYPS